MDYELTKESSRSVVFSEDDKPIIVRSERLLSTVSSIDQRNTLFYLLEMECDDETTNQNLLQCCTAGGHLGSLAAWRIHEFDWPPL